MLSLAMIMNLISHPLVEFMLSLGERCENHNWSDVRGHVQESYVHGKLQTLN